ncbi:hypothetical protein EMIHUDRAFT_232689 [Emiliania huxleyi CCMP1516]|uniref:EF-hand domain-containing protein n=2 Tax=Emiliania huxleyi TaxID=2903 RepID=A0A0D3K448_EMIH1|nr:hypothetical protein EMIHUDRAFT_232689 [Emiliania huxleyi CCMP1516]EOD30533.1 hypothetical protein EMIHUDRAFT_232689 [Emiliania huxleyi CCMP1516]|eukprot:XP_005782962.1 hypothetical protein EMIHUDRAFT_232689 [Emiliania huxleyi CCMP1516]
MVDDNPIGVGIIGAGRIGLVHLEALSSCPDARPVIISNPTLSKAKAAAETYPGMAWTSDDTEVINHPDVDAAVNLCRAKGVKLMTALQRRFDPNFSRVKRSIAEGTIGETIVVKLCSRDPAPPPLKYVQGGGGIFKDMAIHDLELAPARAIHDLDMARFLMASEPVAVLASGSCQATHACGTCVRDNGGTFAAHTCGAQAHTCGAQAHNCGAQAHTCGAQAHTCGAQAHTCCGAHGTLAAFDTANVMVRFANGKDAIIDAPYGYDQRAEAARFRPSPPLPVSQSWVVTGHADMPYDFFMSRYKEAYKQETLAFVRALRRDEPAPCSGRDGLVALIMAIGAGISAEEGRWVRFEEVLQREGIGGMRVSEEGGETAGGGAGWISTMLGSANPRKEDDLREIFLLFDTDDDDLLTEKEVGEATKLLCKDGACPIYTAEEVHSMVRGVDSDRDGRITFDEFLALWRRAGNIEGAAEEANPFAKLLAPLLK